METSVSALALAPGVLPQAAGVESHPGHGPLCPDPGRPGDKKDRQGARCSALPTSQSLAGLEVPSSGERRHVTALTCPQPDVSDGF